MPNKYPAGLKIPTEHGGFYMQSAHASGFESILDSMEELHEDHFGGKIRSYPSIPKEFRCFLNNQICETDIMKALKCNQKCSRICQRHFKAEQLKKQPKQKPLEMNQTIKKQIQDGILLFTKKDLLAWHAFSERFLKENRTYAALVDLCINYLNVTKVGTNTDRRNVGIVTSSNVPVIEHEDLIRDGWTDISQTFGKMDYDPITSKFILKQPTTLQERANKRKLKELEDELGIKINFSDHSREKLL